MLEYYILGAITYCMCMSGNFIYVTWGKSLGFCESPCVVARIAIPCTRYRVFLALVCSRSLRDLPIVTIATLFDPFRLGHPHQTLL